MVLSSEDEMLFPTSFYEESDDNGVVSKAEMRNRG